jgi:heat shock protein HslJ
MSFRPLLLPPLLVVVLGLSGCPQPSGPTAPVATEPVGAPAAGPAPEATPTAAPAPAAPTDLATTLGGHHWRLTSATDAEGQRIGALFPSAERLLTLDFHAGRLGVSGGCNRLNATYTLGAEGQLRIGPARATMMACPPPLMQADAAIGKLLAGSVGATIATVDEAKTLRLRTADGSTLVFTGQPTAETRYGGPGQIAFLEVAPQRVACNHPLIEDLQCLQVRDIHYDTKGRKVGTSDAWRLLYENIQGYTHTPGVRNVVRVKRFERKPVPADASSIVYVLDMVVESETVKP